MDFGLAGKTAVVTGGSSNIGRAIAITLAKEGTNTIIADIDEKSGQKVADLIKSQGGKAKVIKCDVTDYDSVQALVKAVLDEFGAIDVWVNNVGWDDFKYFMDSKVHWEKIIDLNYRHYLNCMHAVLPPMMERKSGRIINIGSDAGRVGEFREAVYSGCKAGVIGLSKSVAKEVGRYGITINVVCPTATFPSPEEMGEESMFTGKDEDHNVAAIFPPEALERLAKSHPLRRTGTAQDTANAVVFLASEQANFITGQTLSVNGGYSMM